MNVGDPVITIGEGFVSVQTLADMSVFDPKEFEQANVSELYQDSRAVAARIGAQHQVRCDGPCGKVIPAESMVFHNQRRNVDYCYNCFRYKQLLN